MIFYLSRMGPSTNICLLLLSVYLMNQIYSVESQTILDQKLFRCNSGEYVHVLNYCNGRKDCADGSDETSQCKMGKCGTGVFPCDPDSKTNNYTCELVKRICDTRKDCPDGSDEANCGDEINVNNCPLSKGKFLCKDKLRCLDLEYTCDSNCNCFDCSDETENCTKITDQSLARCSHSYFSTPSGLRCFCNPDDKTFDSLCKEIKECPKQNPCDQHCSQYKNKMLCSCNDDYIEILVDNGFKCRSKDYNSTIVIYSTSTQIKYLRVDSKKVDIIKENVQSKLLAAAPGDIYYTTFHDDSKRIFWISTSSRKTSEIIKTNSSISSIAIDYITDNLYFTTNQSLSVCSKRGQICIELKCCDVTTPVILAPKFGWMFYMKKSDIPDEQIIMKSNMDGSDENILIDGTFSSVKTLTVDESFARLYWIDQNDRISSISLHDYSLERHVIQLGYEPSVSLKILDEIFFYTTNQDSKIYLQANLERFVKSSTDGEEDESTLRRYYDYRPSPSDSNYTLYKDKNATIGIKNIAVFNLNRQTSSRRKSPCSSASCSGLCLLRPASANSKDNVGFTCACKDFTSSDDKHWCTDSSLQTSQPLQGADSENESSFVGIFLVLILLAAALGGVYLIYQKYFSSASYSRPSHPQSERISDRNQSEI